MNQPHILANVFNFDTFSIFATFFGAKTVLFLNTYLLCPPLLFYYDTVLSHNPFILTNDALLTVHLLSFYFDFIQYPLKCLQIWFCSVPVPA